MPLLSHAEKLFSKDIRVITLVRGKNEQGAPVYCYIAVRADHLERFMDVQKSGKLYDPADYGVILETGEGEPSDEVRQRVSELFQSQGGSHANQAASNA